MCGCSKQTSQNNTEIVVGDKTPTILFETKDDYSLDNLSSIRGYQDDLIEELYQEALIKDENLKNLHDRIEALKKYKESELRDYQNYVSINESYWTALVHHLEGLEDTVLKQNLELRFQKLKSEYEESISGHQAKMAEIIHNENELNDQLATMKILISSLMIKNYQQNEKPDIEPLENLAIEYQNLISAEKNYNQQLK